MPKIADTEKRELILQLQIVEAIKFGNFMLKSGQTSKVYIDMKKALLQPHSLRLLAPAVLLEIGDSGCDSLGCDEGPGPSTLLGALLCWMPTVSGFVVRKTLKTHGTEQPFEGVIGQRPMLLEDVTTTGGSILSAALRMPTRPTMAFSLVDREAGAAEMLLRQGIILTSLFKMSELT